jgi:Family of unknown function (DUF6152)
VVNWHFEIEDSGPEEHAEMKLMQSLHRPSSRTVMNRKVWAILAVVGLSLGAASLWAHHGNAPFDMTHTVRMQGTVTDFQWINPHALILADLKDENGKVANWKLEMGSLGMLSRFGWSRNTVKRGDQVTAEGFRAKDGSAYMCLVSIDLPNGQSMRGSP